MDWRDPVVRDGRKPMSFVTPPSGNLLQSTPYNRVVKTDFVLTNMFV